MSDIKPGLHCKYFDMTLSMETKEVRIVLFNVGLRQEMKNLMNSGLLLSKVTPSNDDYLYEEEKSTFKVVEPKFPMKRFPKPVTKLNDAMTKCRLFARITVELKIVEIEAVKIVNGLSLMECHVIDDSTDEPRQLTIYSEKLFKTVKAGKCYKFTQITVSKFMGLRVLKASDQTDITPLADSAIKLGEYQTVTEIIIGTISNVFMDSLNINLLCPHCKVPGNVDDNIIICQNSSCKLVSLASDAVSKAEIKFSVKSDAFNNAINMS